MPGNIAVTLLFKKLWKWSCTDVQNPTTYKNVKREEDRNPNARLQFESFVSSLERVRKEWQRFMYVIWFFWRILSMLEQITVSFYICQQKIFYKSYLNWSTRYLIYFPSWKWMKYFCCSYFQGWWVKNWEFQIVFFNIHFYRCLSLNLWVKRKCWNFWYKKTKIIHILKRYSFLA